MTIKYVYWSRITLWSLTNNFFMFAPFSGRNTLENRWLTCSHSWLVGEEREGLRIWVSVTRAKLFRCYNTQCIAVCWLRGCKVTDWSCWSLTAEVSLSRIICPSTKHKLAQGHLQEPNNEFDMFTSLVHQLLISHANWTCVMCSPKLLPLAW